MEPNNREYWRSVEKTARERLEELHGQIEEIDGQRVRIVREMKQLDELLGSIAPFTADRPQELIAYLMEKAGEMSLADACRWVLQENDRYLTPINIRDMLDASNFDLSGFTNPLASIHGILKRFEESGEVATVQMGKKTSYRLARKRRSDTPSNNMDQLIRQAAGPKRPRNKTEELIAKVEESATKRPRNNTEAMMADVEEFFKD
jgi:hypothetical protein